MAKVTYAPGIQYLQGSLCKPKKEDGHKHGDYLIATHRKAATTSNDCTRLYIRKADSYVRTTLPSQDELDNRARFAAVSRAVAARRQNLATIATDQAAFVAQKDNPDGKKTFTSYLWKVCGDAYDQNNG